MQAVMEYFPYSILLATIGAIGAVAILKYKQKLSNRKLIVFFIITFLSVAYVFMAWNILFNTTRYDIYNIKSPYHGNYVPLRTIMEYIKRGNIFIFIMQVAGNVLVTIPLPAVAWLYSKKRKIKEVCLISLIITTAIEPIQLGINIFPGGPSNIIDIDDLILNLVGCGLGLFFLRFILQHKEWENNKCWFLVYFSLGKEADSVNSSAMCGFCQRRPA